MTSLGDRSGPARRAGPAARFDRTILLTVWVDVLLSLVVTVVCIVATPVLVVLGFWTGATVALGITAIVLATVLAGCGAVTAALLLRRVQGGEYRLPPRLRLPLPSAMRPLIDDHA